MWFRLAYTVFVYYPDFDWQAKEEKYSRVRKQEGRQQQQTFAFVYRGTEREKREEEVAAYWINAFRRSLATDAGGAGGDEWKRGDRYK